MSTRQRSDKTANYKASFIYITPSILVKISFISNPISITPIVYKNQVSGYGFWTKCYPGFQVRVKKKNNRRAERDEKFFWYQDFMQKSYFFYL